jgi:hypothetical protein
MNDSQTSLSQDPLARLNNSPEVALQDPEGPPLFGYDITSEKRSRAIHGIATPHIMNDSQTSLSHDPLACLNKSPEVALQDPEGPPSLGYDIASKKRSIVTNALSIVALNGITPAALYYILQYGAYHVS